MGFDTVIYINDIAYDAFRGTKPYYYLYSEGSNMDKMKIGYYASSGYGSTQCLIKIGYKNGNIKTENLYGFNDVAEFFGYNSTFLIDMSDVLIVRVAIYNTCYPYVEKFNKKFKKELILYTFNITPAAYYKATTIKIDSSKKSTLSLCDTCDKIIDLNNAQKDNIANETMSQLLEEYN